MRGLSGTCVACALHTAGSKVLTAYHMLKDEAFSQGSGATCFDNRVNAEHALRLVYRLKTPGFEVQIAPSAA